MWAQRDKTQRRFDALVHRNMQPFRRANQPVSPSRGTDSVSFANPGFTTKLGKQEATGTHLDDPALEVNTIYADAFP